MRNRGKFMQEGNQLTLEDEILNLTTQLEEKELIIKSTKEYLLALESENKRINRDYNNYKRESNAKIKNLKKNNKKLKKNNKKADKKIEKMQIKNKELKNEISIIKSTFSWKITRPLRWLKEKF